MTAREALLAAANLVEQGWTRGAYARDKHGRAVYEADPAAVRFCLRGAIYAVCPTEEAWQAVLALSHTLGTRRLAVWNDEQARSGKHVARVMREAAETL